MAVWPSVVLTLALGAGAASAADWPEQRGPSRDGRSAETGLPERWSPDGENLAWRVPYGGRSAPIVVGDRVYLQNGVGEGAERQERVLCFDAETGRLLWEHRFNLYQSDAPPHRIGWANPAADPSTGNVFAFSAAGTLLSLAPDGRVRWERHLQEEFGMVTTHGGRIVSPVVDGGLVIVSGPTSSWGALARGSHRFVAFAVENGDVVWVSSPAGQNLDTTYSPPIIAEINGMRLLIAGAGDGAVHALKVATGEPVWRFAMSKRGINTGVVVSGTTAYVTHSEENFDTSEMGLMAAIDAAATGELGPEAVSWRFTGFLGGFASPILDGDRIYHIDNSANLAAFDRTTGRHLWTRNLGTIQRASPVLADGKLYLGTENGRFFILRPGAEGVEVIHEVQLGTEAEPEEIRASAAVADGRVYLATYDALYAIGTRRARASEPAPTASNPPQGDGAPAHVQVVPTEVILAPGDEVRFRVRLFDRLGRFLREEPKPAWSLAGVQGAIDAGGTFTASASAGGHAGEVRAAVGDLSGAARLRLVPPLPWRYDFEDLAEGGVPPHWVSAAAKFAVREVDGNKVLVKLADPRPFVKRTRTYLGPATSDYTLEVDVLAKQQRRQMGDAGLVGQRYALVLFGNHQRLELQAWQPETERTVIQQYAWKPDVWYRLKLRVENRPDGTARARGKVWPAAEPEPDAWTVERIDPIPNREGAPGVYGDAPAELYFDDLKVYRN